MAWAPGGLHRSAGLRARLASGSVTLYCGFDPTADSLRGPSRSPLALRRFKKRWVIASTGRRGRGDGASGTSGKSAERSLPTKDQIAANVAAVIPQLARLLDFEVTTNPAQVLDNAAWTDQVTFIEFLRDIGKHFTVNQMVAKESVRSRMEDREVGISFTEFSYMLLQAFDFFVLARDHDCELQIGLGPMGQHHDGAGIDPEEARAPAAFGCTLPLITKSDGTKFGKTEVARSGSTRSAPALPILPILGQHR